MQNAFQVPGVTQLMKLSSRIIGTSEVVNFTNTTLALSPFTILELQNQSHVPVNCIKLADLLILRL